MTVWLDAHLSPRIARWLAERLGSPPQVIWLTCGNTSEVALTELLEKHFPTARDLIEKGEALVEIGGAASD